MVVETSASVVLASARALPAEPLQELIVALASLSRESIVDTREIGLQIAATWLLPSQATVLFRHTALTSAVFEELRSSAGPVTVALVSLYEALEAAPNDAKTLPLTVQFQPRASESFRFVFGHGLSPDMVSQALSLVPLVLREAETRLERNTRALESIIGYADASSDEHHVDLVHLYADPVRGWEVLA